MGKRPPPPDAQGPIEPVNLREALEERHLAYALSTIMHRALPDVRDGLKPVHRRVLYAMRQLRLEPQGEFRKCAKIVGDTMGNFHPHGNQAIYDALARLAQTGPLPRAATFITGPSRTADIEKTPQIGVHGPRRLHVVVIDGA